MAATITQKAAEYAAQIRPQIHDDEAPANYFRALRDVAAWMPKYAIPAPRAPARWISASPNYPASTPVPASTPAPTDDGGRPGQAIAACIVHPDER